MAEPVKKLPLYISQISVLITTNDLGCQPAQQQPPQLQDPCRPDRGSLLHRLLRRHHHDLLRAQVGHQHQHVQSQAERREGCEFDSSIMHQVLLISLQHLEKYGRDPAITDDWDYIQKDLR